MIVYKYRLKGIVFLNGSMRYLLSLVGDNVLGSKKNENARPEKLKIFRQSDY